MKYYLAINHNNSGIWNFIPYNNLCDAVSAVINGDTKGNVFKILQELDVVIEEPMNDKIEWNINISRN